MQLKKPRDISGSERGQNTNYKTFTSSLSLFQVFKFSLLIVAQALLPGYLNFTQRQYSRYLERYPNFTFHCHEDCDDKAVNLLVAFL